MTTPCVPPTTIVGTVSACAEVTTPVVVVAVDIPPVPVDTTPVLVINGPATVGISYVPVVVATGTSSVPVQVSTLPATGSGVIVFCLIVGTVMTAIGTYFQKISNNRKMEVVK